jgi:hypothetical protein
MSYIQGRVQRCDNGNGIWATLTDNFGNVASTDQYGLFYSYLAYDGYRITASAGGYIAVNHFVTQAEVNNAWVTICLNDAPPPPTCFTAETLVLMADGSDKPIVDVVVGDVVLGRGGRKNRVTELDIPVLGSRRLFALNGGAPFVTAEHPLWCESGWHAIDPAATARENPALMVAPLRVGARLLVVRTVAVTAGGGDVIEPTFDSVVLGQLEAFEANPSLRLYNLLLDGDHTYFANGYLAHNKGGGVY